MNDNNMKPITHTSKFHFYERERKLGIMYDEDVIDICGETLPLSGLEPGLYVLRVTKKDVELVVTNDKNKEDVIAHLIENKEFGGTIYIQNKE